MTDQTFSTYQAAEFLGVSVRRVQALISTGLLQANKIGRDWIIPREEVERFKEQERQAGRPTKKSSENNNTFLDRPTEIYLQVVEIIRTLLEREGLGTVYRAFAEAASQQIESEVMLGYKPKGLRHVCLYRLLGKKRCPNSIDHPCDSPSNIPGKDHVSEWVQEGKTSKIISQPYNLSYEDIKQMVEFCEERGLRADISAESWHFPGKTLRVDFTVNQRPDLSDLENYN